MDDLFDAFEAAVALVCGGFIFLLFGSTLKTTGFIDFTVWGIVYLLVGVLAILALVGVGTGLLVSKVVE